MKDKIEKRYCVYVYSTLNNIHVAVTDHQGNVISKSSGGSVGFKGANRGSMLAGQKAGFVAGKNAMEKGVSSVHVFLKGFGNGRIGCPKGLRMAGLNITAFESKGGQPHNGCRPKKMRRL